MEGKSGMSIQSLGDGRESHTPIQVFGERFAMTEFRNIRNWFYRPDILIKLVA